VKPRFSECVRNVLGVRKAGLTERDDQVVSFCLDVGDGPVASNSLVI
jgi:hypothetical protein